MNDDLRMHDVVALLEDLHVEHFETRQPLVLRRGQIGTIVMTFDAQSYEVEFAGRDGRPYAVVPITTEKLMLLRDSPDLAAA